jgi:hypothetical protein
MEKEGVSTLISSGLFFWTGNVVGLFLRIFVDLLSPNVSLMGMTLIIIVCMFVIQKLY